MLVNPAANELTGWSDTTTPSLADLNVQDVEQRPVDLRTLVQSAAGGAVAAAEFEVLLTRGDGTISQIKVQSVPVTPDSSRSSGVILALLDITAQRTYEQQLHRAAYYDMLTGLPNRRLLWEWLTVAHANAVPYGVLLIDLNDFKVVNDTLGHTIGDELLAAVGRRLQAVVEPATVARLGGDEFAVMLPHASPAQVEAAAAAVRESFAVPLMLSCGPIHGHGTVGLAVAQPGQSPDDVIAKADVAMYQAKTISKRHTRSPGSRSMWFP
jgi:diguanylate cyclase (GGDEF)-like protein